jgi:hypothetical protein
MKPIEKSIYMEEQSSPTRQVVCLASIARPNSVQIQFAEETHS